MAGPSGRMEPLSACRLGTISPRRGRREQEVKSTGMSASGGQGLCTCCSLWPFQHPVSGHVPAAGGHEPSCPTPPLSEASGLMMVTSQQDTVLQP